MKTQQEVNNFFQENTVHVSAIYQIVQYLKEFNLKLPNNVILHENGIGQAYFFKWFENGPFKPGDVLVSEAGNLVLFSHLEKDVVYYHCILNPFDKFEIPKTPDCGVGKSKNCRLASDNQKQRLLDMLKTRGYEFDSKTNSLKKNGYPTSYENCKVRIHECFGMRQIMGYNFYLLEKFQKLLLCRDTYWKIAGEELGLDKSWKPDGEGEVFVICYSKIAGVYKSNWIYTDNFILSFPTEEMRDAFYENFKDLIEECKELL